MLYRWLKLNSLFAAGSAALMAPCDVIFPAVQVLLSLAFFLILLFQRDRLVTIIFPTAARAAVSLHCAIFLVLLVVARFCRSAVAFFNTPDGSSC